MPADVGGRLPPAAVDCKWWMLGYCSRGKSCYFKHDDAMFAANSKKAKPTAPIEPSSSLPAQIPESVANPTPTPPASSQTCTICFETPDTYGLLINCNHAFCLECIRSWRATSTTNPCEENPDLEKTSKTCPMCRSKSAFVIPSFIWPSSSSSENITKKDIVDGYLGRLKTIPCRYFEHSATSTAPQYRFGCQFGNDCHYAHIHPVTKEPYVFSDAELMRTRRRGGRLQLSNDIAMMNMLLGHLTLEYTSAGEDDDDDWEDEDEDDLDDFDDRFDFGDLIGLPADLDDFGFDYNWD